jgi:signal transduction histidine kinase
MKSASLLRQHFIWIGLCIVVVPLLIMLYVQYTSLAKLGETLPAARKVSFDQKLKDIAIEIQHHYRALAEQTLAVPDPVFTTKMLEDWPALDASVKAHFERQPSEDVKAYFVTIASTSGDRRVLSMYNTRSRSMLEGHPSMEGWAAFAASAPWVMLMRKQADLESYGKADGKDPGQQHETLFFADNDPENPIILKPVFDRAGRLIGIAGLVIDNEYFKSTFLPKTLAASSEKLFSDDERKAISLVAYDDSGNLQTATKAVQGKSIEVKAPLQFVFPRWHLGVQSGVIRLDHLEHQYLVTSLSLSGLMTLIIIGGLVLALRAAMREMRLSQMKTDFVSNVSHELRTPLSSIRVFGELQRLGRVRDHSKVREYGEFIETESRRLTQLINNILDFSRIESGQKTYRFSQADLPEIVEEALKTFEVRLQQDGFDLRVEAPDEDLAPAVVDAEAISQVIVNLLDNAVKYSGSSREIIIRLGQQQDDYVSVAVTDFGIGIPVEEQEKIFERFHRVSTGLVHDVRGSGLGLSLVKRIVEDHGGRVVVSSEVGRGSTFTVSLPVWETQTSTATSREKVVDTALPFHVEVKD